MGDDREIHVHVHVPGGTDDRIDEVLAYLARIEQGGTAMAADLSRITNEVSEVGTVIDSAVALINGLSGQVRDLASELEAQGVDVASVNALADSLDSKAGELSAAVAANTPADPEAPDNGGEGEVDDAPEPTPEAPGDGTAESAPGAENGGEAPAPTAVEEEAGALVDAGSSADVPEPTPDVVQAEANSPADRGI